MPSPCAPVQPWSALAAALLVTAAVTPATAGLPWRQLDREGQPCTDSSGRNGTCGFILGCLQAARIASVADAGRRLSNIMDRRSCGSSSGQPLVCCSDGGALPAIADVSDIFSSAGVADLASLPSLPALSSGLFTVTSGRPPADEPTAPAEPPAADHPSRRLLADGGPCGVSLADRIFGGRVSRRGRFPWLAALAYVHPTLGGPVFRCGGALISSRYVLTAAHCATALIGNYRLDSVHLGEHRFDGSTASTTAADDGPPTQRFRIDEVVVHQRYNQPRLHRNDIALLRLDRAADEAEERQVRRICLPLGEWRTRDWAARSLTVAGFGLTQNDGQLSPVLRDVELPVVESAQCQGRLTLRDALGLGQLCLGGQVGLDTCKGDSGGPAVFAEPGGTFHAVAIVSFGPVRCGSTRPGVYTLVSEYLGWVLDNMRQ